MPPHFVLGIHWTRGWLGHRATKYSMENKFF